MNKVSHYIQKRKIQNSLSYWVIALIAIYIITINFKTKYWEMENRVIINDIKLYYVYLPAIVIQNDLSFEYADNEYIKNINDLWFVRSPKGIRTVITSIGMSIVYSPFFLIAHVLASPLGYDANGYTLPYKFVLMFSSLIYVLLGLFFLRKLLLKYFNNTVTAITLLIIGLGTNLTIYLTKEAPMPHAYEFGLISIYLYLVYKWYEKPKMIFSFWVGFLAGLITLIRPTNILVLLILIFWGITSFNDLTQKIRFFIKAYKPIIIMTISFILIWLPQFIYWKYISGQFFYYSYQETGDHFFFRNPQILDQLFSYRKGWIIYTPIMILALSGFVFLFKNRKELFLPILIYFLVMIYILSSWWCWWFGGGYSIRSYIDMYGILAIPVAASIKAILKSKLPIKIFALSLVGFLLFLNLFQTYQYRKGIIHYDSMTKEAYWGVFLKKHHPHDYYQLLEKPDYQKARKGIYEIVPEYYSGK